MHWASEHEELVNLNTHAQCRLAVTPITWKPSTLSPVTGPQADPVSRCRSVYLVYLVTFRRFVLAHSQNAYTPSRSTRNQLCPKTMSRARLLTQQQPYYCHNGSQQLLQLPSSSTMRPAVEVKPATVPPLTTRRFHQRPEPESNTIERPRAVECWLCSCSGCRSWLRAPRAVQGTVNHDN